MRKDKTFELTVATLNMGGRSEYPLANVSMANLSSDQQRRIEAVVTEFDASRPDILALQEVPSQEVAEHIASQIGCPREGCLYSESSRPGTGMALFSRFGHFDGKLLVDTLSVGGKAPTRLKRPAMRLHLPITGSRYISIISAHLKSNFVRVPADIIDSKLQMWFATRKVSAAESRLAEALALRALVIQETEEGADGVILAGDLNDIPGSATIALLTGSSLFLDSPTIFQANLARSLLISPLLSRKTTNHSVDYILISAPLWLAMKKRTQLPRQSGQTIFVDKSGLFDHEPIYCHLSLDIDRLRKGDGDSNANIPKLQKLARKSPR